MKSNLEWQKWGEVDPLYAVATAKGKERDSPDAWTDTDFYEYGRREWEALKRHWEQYGVTYGRCVEVGCGAGRITKQLATSFEAVSALDVSEGQIAYARERIQAPTVRFHLTNGIQIPLETESADAAFSIYVFQHFESLQDATAVFNELKRVLTPGGTLMIQLPLYEFPDSRIRSLFQGVARGFKMVSDLKAAANRRVLKAGIWRPMMRRLRFEQQVLARILRQMGFDDVEFRTFRGSAAEDYSFLLARCTVTAGESRCMKQKLRMFIRQIGLSVAGLFASELHDCATGEKIGRALLIAWRGKVHVIGLDAAIRVLWLPQKRLTYWRQEIGFTKHPPPDFPRTTARRPDYQTAARRLESKERL